MGQKRDKQGPRLRGICSSAGVLGSVPEFRELDPTRHEAINPLTPLHRCHTNYSQKITQHHNQDPMQPNKDIDK